MYSASQLTWAASTDPSNPWSFMTVPHPIETERLLLRQWISADREPFARLNNDAEVMRYFPARLSRAESDTMADRLEGLIAERGWGFWAVEEKVTGHFIGFTAAVTRQNRS